MCRNSLRSHTPNRDRLSVKPLFAFLVVWAFSLPVQAQYGGGSGTAGDPFIIDTPAKMNDIGLNTGDWDKHFKLTADIDLIGYDGIGGNPTFNIIGNTTTNFTGVFNGNFHTISNFTYSSSGTNNVGIFGVAGGSFDMKIRDLGLDNPNVNAGTGNNVGAIVGQLLSKGYVLHCSVAGGSVSGNNNVGGIMGYGNLYARLYNSYSTANVSGTDCVGGLVGKIYDHGRLHDSYSAGSVSGTTNTGGLLGFEDGYVYSEGTVVDSFWDTQTSGQATSAGGGTGRTTAQMQDVNTFLNAGWDFVGYTTNGVGDIWAEPAGGGYPVFWWQLSPLPPLPAFSGGSGTIGDPYLISTAGQLNSIGGNPRLMEAHFKLTDNIDLTGVSFWMMGGGRYPFTGTFDGNDHTISNFTYNVPGSYVVGIFSSVGGANAEVKDLGIIDPNIIAGTGGYGQIGALVAVLYNGTISNCYMVNGNISGGHTTAGLIGDMENGTVSDCYVRDATIYGDSVRIGGLVGGTEAGTISNCYTTTTSISGWRQVGGLAGDVDPCATVTNCYSDGSVYGITKWDLECEDLGGLIGTNQGTVSACYAMGDVISNASGDGAYLGGLMGYNNGSVSDCYATGNVSDGRFSIGGLIGYAMSSGVVSNCYSTGSVSGTTDVGGLIGNNYGTVTASFWDKETSGKTNGVGSGSSSGVTGKTTADMQTQSTFTDAGWDFVGETVNGPNDIWTIHETVDYPKLVWELVNFVGWYEVDFVDFAFFAGRWGDANCGLSNDCDGTDVDFSDAVDWADLKIFCDHWLAGVE